MQLHGVAQVLRDFCEVFFVVLGKQDFEQSGAMRGQQLLFQSANGKHFATQRDFARHGDVATDGNSAQRAGNGGGNSNSGGGAVFGNGSLGNVHVNIERAVKLASQSQSQSTGADVGHGRLRRLLHDVAQFTGERELAFAVNDAGLGAQNRAANFGPSKPGDQTNFALFVGEGIAELGDTQEIVKIFGGNGNAVIRAFFDHLARHFAADVPDLPFQIADAGFARVGADESGDGFVAELDVLFRHARLLQLLTHQELLGDFHFLLLGVTVQPQYFHAVLQGGRNGVHNIRGGDKEHLRKVVFDVQVM